MQVFDIRIPIFDNFKSEARSQPRFWLTFIMLKNENEITLHQRDQLSIK